MPLKQIGPVLLAATILLTGLSALAWVFGWRQVGAALMGISLGGAFIPVLAAPVTGADRVVRQMRFDQQDPRRLTDIEPMEITWGLGLVTLWRLRWLILIGLALTPALMVSAVRLDLSDFKVWQESFQTLGRTTAAGQAEWLLNDGSIPHVRIVIRAISLGLLPWAMLPLTTALGVTAAFVLRDVNLSPLAALLGTIILPVPVVLFWNWLSRTTVLAGGLEIIRLAFLLILLAAISGSAAWLNWQNALILSDLKETTP
jgi:hypothetical protein